MTNHGVQDRIVDFFIGHKIPEVDRVYWFRRVEELRKIYAERQQCLNPLSQKPEFDLSKLEGLRQKIEELEERIKALEESKTNADCDVKIVTSEEELVYLNDVHRSREGEAGPIPIGKRVFVPYSAILFVVWRNSK